jgi:hypothetical protein
VCPTVPVTPGSDVDDGGATAGQYARQEPAQLEWPGLSAVSM